MEINPLSGPPPQGPRAKPVKKNEARPPVKTDHFTGPSTGRLLDSLSNMDAVRADKVEAVRKEIEEGHFLTEERIQGLIDRLSRNL